MSHETLPTHEQKGLSPDEDLRASKLRNGYTHFAIQAQRKGEYSPVKIFKKDMNTMGSEVWPGLDHIVFSGAAVAKAAGNIALDLHTARKAKKYEKRATKHFRANQEAYEEQAQIDMAADHSKGTAREEQFASTLKDIEDLPESTTHNN